VSPWARAPALDELDDPVSTTSSEERRGVER